MKLLYSGGDAVISAFGQAARLTSLTDWARRVTSYAYDPDGALQNQTNPNGTLATYAYDHARRLTEVWNKTSTSATDAITRHQFTMDAVGTTTYGYGRADAGYGSARTAGSITSSSVAVLTTRIPPGLRRRSAFLRRAAERHQAPPRPRSPLPSPAKGMSPGARDPWSASTP